MANKLSKKTKVLNAGNSLSVTVPKFFCDILELKKGTPVELELDLETKEIKIKKWEEDK